jgi:hypothetical protein
LRNVSFASANVETGRGGGGAAGTFGAFGREPEGEADGAGEKSAGEAETVEADGWGMVCRAI